MDLINRNKPMLIIRPDDSHSNNYLTEQALCLQQELTQTLSSIDWTEVSTKNLSKSLSLSKHGISRLIGLTGSISILSNDSISAEKITNDTLDELSVILNSAMLELKMRSATDQEDLFVYLEELNELITNVEDWNEGKPALANKEEEVKLIFE